MFIFIDIPFKNKKNDLKMVI